MSEGLDLIEVVRWSAAGLVADEDAVTREEPLEIRLNGRPLSITMRTPGNDLALVMGFLHGEGLVRGPADVRRLASPEENVVEVETAEPVDPGRLERHFYASSSCGVCGKASLKAIATLATPLTSTLTASAADLQALPGRLAAAQQVFARAGSLHATLLAGPHGDVVEEDVGRHNAVDKAIGGQLLAGRSLEQSVMLVSGRTSFEIVQKAVVARIPIVAAISGPSSLAVELARGFGVTLVGFLRPGRFNVYSHPGRISA